MLSSIPAEVTCFLLVQFGPIVAIRSSRQEFPLERLCVLVPSEASLVCD
jgi:hypothetical protein